MTAQTENTSSLLRRWFGRYQPETIVFFVWPVIAFVLIAIFHPAFYANLISQGEEFSLFIFFFGQFFVVSLLVFFGLYGVFSVFRLGFFYLQAKIKKQSPPRLNHHPLAIAKSAAYLIFGAGCASVANYAFVFELSHVPVERVINASALLMDWDYKVFGTYPPFAMQKYFQNAWGDLSLYIYKEFSGIFALVYILSFLSNKPIFRRFIVATIIAFIISIPIWLAFPGISPEEMYRANILNLPLSNLPHSEIVSSTEYQSNLLALLSKLGDYWSKPGEHRFAVTAFPSMHVAWGLIAVYYGVLLWRPLWLVLLPACILNIIGTIYTLQHYAVDLPAGMSVAVLALYLAHLMFKRTDETKNDERFLLVDIFQKDMKTLYPWIK